MQRGWLQRWRDVLFQHFEIRDMTPLQHYLPKDCEFDSFDGKYYLGLVLMQMSDVRHRSFEKFVWFKSYNELNLRTYITYKGKRGVLFFSLDVDSLISVLGARVLYGLPYRLRRFEKKGAQKMAMYDVNKLRFETSYELLSEPKHHQEGSFAYWATERYFFANRYFGVSFMGEIAHKPWELSIAKAKNSSLEILSGFKLGERHEDVLFSPLLEVKTSTLKRIK